MVGLSLYLKMLLLKKRTKLKIVPINDKFSFSKFNNNNGCAKAQPMPKSNGMKIIVDKTLGLKRKRFFKNILIK